MPQSPTLLNALALQGQHYNVAAVVENPNLIVEIAPYGLASVVDRDVILVRDGINFTCLAGDQLSGGLCGVQIPDPAFGSGPIKDFSQFLQSTPSTDGCNYTVVAKVPFPLLPPALTAAPPTIDIKRGFVGIDATVRGKTYRFVATHLEQRVLMPEMPETAIYQSVQALELFGTLLATTPSDRKLILIGDFNSSSEDAGVDGYHSAL